MTNSNTNLSTALDQSNALEKSLSPLMIWGLGVGYVISGMYFGWNLGLVEGGPIGLLIATLLVTVMYIAFVYCYAELASMMPRAGGAFYYSEVVGGPRLGVIAGFAQLCEFVFAPPAIAYAIGAYFSLFFDNASPLAIAIFAYVVFTLINIAGVKLSASLELFLTTLAVVELLIFAGVTAPHFSWAHFIDDPLPHGYSGIFMALPFAIWFFLAIEGIANIAEEAKNPQRDLAVGFKCAMATLVPLALLVLFCSVGIDGWRAVVFPPGSNIASDSPLPLAMAKVVGQGGFLYHLLITVGLFGLIASFHGIILASGRVTLELGRARLLPSISAHTLKQRKTPAIALLANMGIGILALLSGRTADIITLAVMGALVLYISSMYVFMLARKKFPNEPRPFVAPYAPLTPMIAISIAVLSLASVFWAKPGIAVLFIGLFGIFSIYALKFRAVAAQ
jgi:ethanolamine permease